MALPLECFLHTDSDRPELLEIAHRKELNIIDSSSKYNFQLQYVPSTASVKDEDIAKQLLKNLFAESEHQTVDDVFADDKTQSLSLMYYVMKNGCLRCGCVSTIVFRLVNKPKETEPFMFVFYRGSDRTPLFEREKNDYYYAKCKYQMNNLDIGHMLLKISQQLLCDNDKVKNSFRTFLVATPNLIEHYIKLDFRVLQLDEKEKIDDDVPEELKQCMILENFSKEHLKFLILDEPLKKDTIYYRRKLEKNNAGQAAHVNDKLVTLQESKCKKVLESCYKEDVEILSSELSEQLFQSYLDIETENFNPFSIMTEQIGDGANLKLVDIVDKYHNLLTIENVNESDSENEIDDVPTLDMSYVDKLMLKQFELTVDFDGKLHGKTVATCEKGNIYCKICNKNILHEDSTLVELISFGANMMHYHLTTNSRVLGFTSESSWERFNNVDNFDKDQKIILCESVNRTDICKHLFRAINLDAAYDEEKMLAASTQTIAFVQNVLLLYYGESHSLYIQFLKKSARQYTKYIEQIQSHLRKNYKKKEKKAII